MFNPNDFIDDTLSYIVLVLLLIINRNIFKQGQFVSEQKRKYKKKTTKKYIPKKYVRNLILNISVKCIMYIYIETKTTFDQKKY